jgi:hypothetical protein
MRWALEHRQIQRQFVDGKQPRSRFDRQPTVVPAATGLFIGRIVSARKKVTVNK